MIQKGIIEQVIDKYTYKVRVPRYDKAASDPSATKTKDLPDAIVCCYPGTEVVFSKGNIVLLDYENDELNQPVILGLLYNASTFADEDDYLNFNSPVITDALFEYNEEIKSLQDAGVYTYIKYSNDGGKTFTSLFEHEKVFTNIHTENIMQSIYRVATDIEINPASSSIFWEITDNSGQNVTNDFSINTIVHSSDINLDGSAITKSFNTSLIDIPLNFQNLSDLKIDFNLKIKGNIDSFDENYHVVLTTDKNVIGSAYGKYLGICISTSSIAPDSPNEYTWSSFERPVLELINTLQDDWKPRIQRLEQTLFGRTYDDETSVSDGLGITDVLSISENKIDLHGENNRDISFNNNKSIYIDNVNVQNVTPSVYYKYPTIDYGFQEAHGTNGHLTLLLKRE